MATSGRTIYIAGAGIAGMTLALALAKFGATVVVLERNKKVQEVGAGIQTAPNASRILLGLGLRQQLTAIRTEPLDQVRRRWRDGAIIAQGAETF